MFKLDTRILTTQVKITTQTLYLLVRGLAAQSYVVSSGQLECDRAEFYEELNFHISPHVIVLRSSVLGLI